MTPPRAHVAVTPAVEAATADWTPLFKNLGAPWWTRRQTVGLDGDARSELRRRIVGAQQNAGGAVGAPDTTAELSRDLHDLLGDEQRVSVVTMLLRDLVRISRADRHER